MTLSRRNMLGGLIATLTAPAIVKYGSLMPVRGIVMPVDEFIHIEGIPLQNIRHLLLPGLYTVTGRNQYNELVTFKIS